MTTLVGQATRPPSGFASLSPSQPSRLLPGLSCLHACEWGRWASSLEALLYPVLDKSRPHMPQPGNLGMAFVLSEGLGWQH